MYNQYRNTLMGNGYIPLPVRGKIPAIKKFTDADYTPPQGFNGLNIAILCGTGQYPICAIDIDVTDNNIVRDIVKCTGSLLKPTIQRTGQSPKTLLVYRASKPGIRKKRTNVYDKGSIEVLGKGQYFVTHGTHTVTHKPYTWIGTNMIHVNASTLPVVTENQITDLIVKYDALMLAAKCVVKEKHSDTKLTKREYDCHDPLLVKPPLLIPDTKLQGYLSQLNPDCSRRRWIQIGMALHHETSGNDQGFSLWDDWSSKGTKYKKEEMENQWNSFGKNEVEPLTVAYILKIIKDKKTEKAINKNKIPQDQVYIPDWGNAPIGASPLLFLNTHRILSRGSIAVISAPAGQGKTQLVSAICAAVPKSDFDNVDTIGFESTANSIMYIDTEQNKWEHHNTWRKCMYRLGLKEGDETPASISFRLISEMEDITDRKAFLFDILTGVDAPDIVLLDGIGDYVQDVNDSAECVSLVYKLSAILKAKEISLLTTLHVNPSANAEKMRGVLGSELWRKAEFSAIIKRVDSEMRCLTTEYLLGKNRSGVDILSQHFRWCTKSNMMVSCAPPETKDKIASKETKKLILTFLQSKIGQEISRKAINAVPASRYSVDHALCQLIDNKQVEITKKGRNNLFSLPKGEELW